MRIRRPALASALVIAVAAAPALAQAPVSLGGAVSTALARNQSVVAARESLRAAEARLVQVRAGRGIQLVFSANAGVGNASTIPPGGSPAATASGGLSAQLPLVDLQIREQIRQAEAGVASAQASFAKTQQDVALAAGQAYVTSLQAQAVVAVREAAVEQAQTQVGQAEAQVRAGVAARADVLRAQAQLAQAQVDLIQARNAVESSLARLRGSLGVPLAEAVALAPPPAPPAITLTRDQAVAGSAGRPEVAQARSAVASAQSGLALAEIQARPLAAVTAGSSLDLFRNPGQITWSITATFGYSLIDGGRARAAIAEARANLAAARAREAQTLQDVQVAALTAWIDAQDAAARVVATRASETAAAEALRAAEGRYRAGVAPILEVIEARTAFLTATLARVQAEFDVQTAALALRYALGRPVAEGAL